MRRTKNPPQNMKNKVQREFPSPPTNVVHPAANLVITHFNGYQPQRSRVGEELKLFDSTQALTPSTTGNISKISSIPQGVGVRQREGDSLEIKSLTINLEISLQNADIFCTTRIIFFQWKTNDNLLAPTVAQILESVATTSMYNWANSGDYLILDDFTIYQSGTAAAPCDSGLQGFTGRVIPLAPAKRKLTYNAGATTGINQLYILTLSTSIIAPFPILTIQTRLIFSS